MADEKVRILGGKWILEYAVNLCCQDFRDNQTVSENHKALYAAIKEEYETLQHEELPSTLYLTQLYRFLEVLIQCKSSDNIGIEDAMDIYIDTVNLQKWEDEEIATVEEFLYLMKYEAVAAFCRWGKIESAREVFDTHWKNAKEKYEEMKKDLENILASEISEDNNNNCAVLMEEAGKIIMLLARKPTNFILKQAEKYVEEVQPVVTVDESADDIFSDNTELPSELNVAAMSGHVMHALVAHLLPEKKGIPLYLENKQEVLKLQRKLRNRQKNVNHYLKTSAAKYFKSVRKNSDKENTDEEEINKETENLNNSAQVTLPQSSPLSCTSTPKRHRKQDANRIIARHKEDTSNHHKMLPTNKDRNKATNRERTPDYGKKRSIQIDRRAVKKQKVANTNIDDSSSIESIPSSDDESVASSTTTATRQAKRRWWTLEEELELVKGVEEYGEGNWAVIRLGTKLRHKTNISIKDKWRNLVNGGKLKTLKKKMKLLL